MAERARQVPALQAAFRRLYLNQWTESENPWLDIGARDECGDRVADDELRGKACYGGLDLSATADLAAFELVFPKGDRIYRRGMAWLPQAGLRERELNDRVPHSRWAQEGGLELTTAR